MTTERKHRELPECPSYVAHPQSVWFRCHWRPIIDELKAELDFMNKNCISLGLHDSRMKNAEDEIAQLKSNLRTSDLNRQSLWSDSIKLTGNIMQLKQDLKIAVDNLNAWKERFDSFLNQDISVSDYNQF